MIKTYHLQYVGRTPIRAWTKDWKREVKPFEVFETDINHFKDIKAMYSRLFKEVEVETSEKPTIEEPVEEVEQVADESDDKVRQNIEELRAMYKDKMWHNITPRYKNDYDYIYAKVYS